MDNFIISVFSEKINSDIQAYFESLNKLGVKYFEPTEINGKNIKDFTDDEVFTLLTAMKKYGIRASCIGSSIGKIGIRDNFDEHFEKFKRVIEISKMLGTEYIRIFSFYIPEGQNPDLFRGEVTFRLVKMITYAKSQGVVLLHENEKGTYGDTPLRCDNLFDALYSQNFKAIFSSENFLNAGEDIKKAYEDLSEYIAYMHINDINTDIGEYLLKSLKETDYFGFIGIEPHIGDK